MELWNLLGKNSGQVNVILTFFAVAFAIIAARYAKIQINVANQQRMIQIRTETFDRAQRSLVSILEAKHGLKKLKQTTLLKAGVTEQSILSGENYSIEEYFNFLSETINNIGKPIESIVLEIEENWEKISLNRLAFLNKSILSLEASLEKSLIGMNHRLDDVQNIYLNN